MNLRSAFGKRSVSGVMHDVPLYRLFTRNFHQPDELEVDPSYWIHIAGCRTDEVRSPQGGGSHYLASETCPGRSLHSGCLSILPLSDAQKNHIALGIDLERPAGLDQNNC